MSDDKYLQFYLKHNFDWPSKVKSMGVFKYDPIYQSVLLFSIFYPDKTHEEYMDWRHHRMSSSWEDDIFSMTDAEFKYHWPLIVGLLTWVEE